MSATVKILTEAAIELEPIRSSVSQRGHGSDARSLVSNKSNNTPAPIPASSTQDDARSVNSVKLQLLSCCVCFIVAGLNDGSLGTLLPYLLSTYNLSTSFVGIMYATSFAGWFLAAMVMPFMVDAVGSKGTLLAGAILYTIAQVLRVWSPPFALFSVTFFLSSLAQAFQDAQANIFVSEIKASHLWLGLIHASYALGLLIAPLVANSIALQPGRWALYYAVPLAIGFVNIALVLTAFFTRSDFHKLGRCTMNEAEAVQPNEAVATPDDGKTKLQRVAGDMKETLSVKPVWLLSLFYFFYLGAVFTIGGYVVLFLTDVRGLSLRSAGYVPTGFYVGSFIARLALPHPTHTWLGGEHWMLMIYITIILALQLVSWLVHSAVATAVTVSCIGFFFGPFFASGMQVAKETIPRKVRGNALALIFVVAQLGAAVFPAITGAIASKKGVEVLQPFAVGLIALTGVSWWFVPTKSIEREGNDDES